jgi:hypothetical protein
VANSTNIISDLRAVAASTPTATSTAKAINPTGPITDLNGMIADAVLLAKELVNRCNQIANASDSGDANYYTKVLTVVATLGS